MNISKNLFLACLFIIFTSGFRYKRIDYRQGMFKNVCKDLKGNVLVYFVFVDSKSTLPWTEFDIQSTIDSIETAIRWIERQAKTNNVLLQISSDYYIGAEYATVKKNLPYNTVAESISTPSFRKGLHAVNKWADNIAKKIGADVQIAVKDGIPEIKNPKNKERLVAHFRDEKQVESVALLFMLNNYYRDDISIPINHLGTEDVEFAVVSYKYSAVIAQNILNLFGASDHSKTLYRRNEQKIRLLNEFFPNEIMQDVYAKSISNLEINEYTKYLIGWKDDLDPKYYPLLTDKIANF